MASHRLLPAFAAGAVLLCAAPARAQDKPEAWVAKLQAIAEKPVEADFTKLIVLNHETRVSKGHLLFLDRDHFRIALHLRATSPAWKGKAAETDLLNLADGKTLWMAAIGPDLPEGQVRKQSLVEAHEHEVGKKKPPALDPVSQLLAALEDTTLESVEVGPDKVVLKALYTEDAKVRLVPQFRGGIPNRLVAELDPKTAFPRSWKVNSNMKTIAKNTYSAVHFVVPEEVDPELFQFEGAENLKFHDPERASATSKKGKE